MGMTAHLHPPRAGQGDARMRANVLVSHGPGGGAIRQAWGRREKVFVGMIKSMHMLAWARGSAFGNRRARPGSRAPRPPGVPTRGRRARTETHTHRTREARARSCVRTVASTVVPGRRRGTYVYVSARRRWPPDRPRRRRACSVDLSVSPVAGLCERALVGTCSHRREADPKCCRDLLVASRVRRTRGCNKAASLCRVGGRVLGVGLEEAHGGHARLLSIACVAESALLTDQHDHVRGGDRDLRATLRDVCSRSSSVREPFAELASARWARLQAKGLFSVPFVTLEIYGEELAEEEVSGRPIVCVLNTMESRGTDSDRALLLACVVASSTGLAVASRYLMRSDDDARGGRPQGGSW
eukprot:scaffold2554_cov321-Prasinococcus_capsulatus_cf.AAC.5